MSGSSGPEGGEELEQSHAPDAPATPDVAADPTARPRTTPTGRPAWAVFIGIAVAVVVLDQVSKAWVIANIAPGSSIPLAGQLLRLIHSKNDGALFGLFGSAAPILAVASVVVISLIVWFHARSGRNLLISIALGLLLGGALGNLIDRLRLGYVVDWVDAGIGGLRFWTFNVGDAAISTALVLLLASILWPSLGRPSTDG